MIKCNYFKLLQIIGGRSNLASNHLIRKKPTTFIFICSVSIIVWHKRTHS